MLTFDENQIIPFQRTFLLIGEQNVSTDVDISVAQGASPSFEGEARLHLLTTMLMGRMQKN